MTNESYIRDNAKYNTVHVSMRPEEMLATLAMVNSNLALLIYRDCRSSNLNLRPIEMDIKGK